MILSMRNSGPVERLKVETIATALYLPHLIFLKILNYILAAVIGAVLATVVNHRISRFTSEQESAASIVMVRPRPVPGPSPVEFAQLKREKADLDAALSEARAKLAEHDAVLTQTKQSLEELRRPMTTDMMSSALRAQLKSGEVVVTGGYQLPNGKRLYAFAQPVVQQVDGKEVVKIGSRFLSVTDEAGKSVGLDSIATNAANTIQHGEVWVADEQAAVLAKLDAAAGTDTISSPSITVLAGGSGTVEIGDLKLSVTPVVAADHANMDFEVRVEQPQTPPPTETPPTTQGKAAPPTGVEK